MTYSCVQRLFIKKAVLSKVMCRIYEILDQFQWITSWYVWSKFEIDTWKQRSKERTCSSLELGRRIRVWDIPEQDQGLLPSIHVKQLRNDCNSSSVESDASSDLCEHPHTYMHTYINTYIGIYIYTDTEKIKQILYKGRGKNESDEKVEYILSNFRVYDKVIVI